MGHLHLMLEVEGSWEVGQKKVPCGKLCKAEQPLVLHPAAPCCQQETEPSRERSSFGLGRCPGADAGREPTEREEGNRLSDL